MREWSQCASGQRGERSDGDIVTTCEDMIPVLVTLLLASGPVLNTGLDGEYHVCSEEDGERIEIRRITDTNPCIVCTCTGGRVVCENKLPSCPDTRYNNTIYYIYYISGHTDNTVSGHSDNTVSSPGAAPTSSPGCRASVVSIAWAARSMARGWSPGRGGSSIY